MLIVRSTDWKNQQLKKQITGIGGVVSALNQRLFLFRRLKNQVNSSKYMFRRCNQTMEPSSHRSKNSQDYHSSKKRKQKLLLDVAYLKCWPDNLHYYHYLHSNTSFLIIKLFYLRQINLCYYYYYYYERVIIYVTDETKLRC